MTTKEAIYLLRNTAWVAPSLEPIDEAVEMACEALAKDINVRSKDEPRTEDLQDWKDRMWAEAIVTERSGKE